MIKAIFFDVDGTLVSLRTHAVPQSTQNALARLREEGIGVSAWTVNEEPAGEGDQAFCGHRAAEGDAAPYSGPVSL